jgi:redox-sensitive bicupin YhaK (pirin superfamily)
MNTNKRSLDQVYDARPATDGDGVRIQRNIAGRALPGFDPFLLLDEIASDEAADYIGGFPEHPHRGFETVTYMLEGSMKHRDHLGNEGLLVSGSVQWMTAGRGVLHSEMPMQESGRLHGFQLWINLPAAEKLCEPKYQEYPPDAIPQITVGSNSTARVIAGTLATPSTSVTGPVGGVSTQPDFFDLDTAAGDSVSIPLEAGKRGLLYVYQGSVLIDDGQQQRPLKRQQLGVLGDGDSVAFVAAENSRLLLLAGVPIKEPIVNWGPFVMNSPGEIEQAIRDYQQGRLV